MNLQNRGKRGWVYGIVTLGLIICVLSTYETEWKSSSQIHTLLETIATTLAAIVGTLALVRYYSRTENIYLFVGIGFLGAGLLDAHHAITTSDYLQFQMLNGLSSLIPWSWIASRQFLAVLLFLSWAFWLKGRYFNKEIPIRPATLYGGACVFIASCFLLFAFAPLPQAFYPNLFFSRPEEFVPALFFGLALLGYLNKGQWKVNNFEHWLVLSLIVAFFGQVGFMSHSNTLFDYNFDITHVLKIVSYLLVFSGLTVSMKTAFQREQTLNRGLTSTIEELNFQKHALDEHAIVSITDAKGDITYSNHKFSEISGYSKKELLGNKHSILNSGHHSQEFFIDMWKTIANGNTWTGKIKNKRKNGEFYWVNTTIIPDLDEAGKSHQYIGIRTDITELKENEEALKLAIEKANEASLAKSNFLAAMSHEIRTPMAGVLGMADLIISSKLSPEQLDWATSIKLSGENLLEILNEILDKSKLDAGKIEITPVDFHLASFVHDKAYLFSPKIEEKGLYLNVKLDEKLPQGIHADSLRIGQILANLLSNAFKFTEKGGILLHIEPNNDETNRSSLRFTISDSGIGLSNEATKNIFTAFSQADNSTSRIYGGTGLGLSISKQMTELMGGEIGVESVPGSGSNFWFTVPYQPIKQLVPTVRNKDRHGHWYARRSLQILIAEDNDINQALINAILKKLNHNITMVENGKLAVEKVRAEYFDMILMDIRMPVMDGIEATKIIRSMDMEKSNTPIVALTADIAAGNIKSYMDSGMDQVCGKPLDIPLLMRAMNSALGEDIHVLSPNISCNKTRQAKGLAIHQ